MAGNDLRNGARREYPFSAVVGNALPKEGLRCALASPDISSVLICGPKGAGKSVLARSVATVTDRRIVVLPLGATEDGVFGGMDFEGTLREGRKVATKGVLERADGNILLVENINLLPPHLVFQVMNAAETRMNVVERDGVSQTVECGFLLIATMDADEGTIPNHVLDRFDICVFTSTMEDEEDREEIVRRRLSYEVDPDAFISEWSEEDRKVAEDIERARARVRFTRVPDGYLAAITEVCTQLMVAGHRGDVAVMNASCSFAALDGRDSANLDDLKSAAAVCLEHRRNDPPEDQRPPEQPPEDDRQDQDDNQNRDQDQNRDETPPGEPLSPDLPPPPEGKAEEQVFDIGETFRVKDYMPRESVELSRGNAGRNRNAFLRDDTGRCIGYRIPIGKVEDVALTASIRAAAPYQIAREHNGLAVVLKKEDLREKVREKRMGRDILFLVDGSGSIGAQKRMVAVKGAILSMLRDAYQKRDSIGMAVFRIDRAEEVLPLTRSILKAYKTLADIPTGGRTPLTHGLIKGMDILSESASKGSRPVMVIISDGRCNVSYTPGKKPVDEMLATARALSQSPVRFIVIDTEAGRMRFGLSMELARALNGTYLRLEDLNAEYIERSVMTAIDGRSL